MNSKKESPDISIVTLSVRSRGLLLVEKALSRQEKKSFEWIIGSPEKPVTRMDHVWVKDPEKKDGDYWEVYKQYNKCTERARGKLIVSVQDFTYFLPDALQKFWDHYQEDNKVIVTGVGNKYENDDWLVQTWQDPRQRSDQGTYYGCHYNDIEWNLCAIPKAAIVEVGGFDERLDKYSSLCGLDVLDRLNIKGGWDFRIDQTNESFSLEHGRLPGWEENSPFNGAYDKIRKEYLENPVLDYLK